MVLSLTTTPHAHATCRSCGSALRTKENLRFARALPSCRGIAPFSRQAHQGHDSTGDPHQCTSANNRHNADNIDGEPTETQAHQGSNAVGGPRRQKPDRERRVVNCSNPFPAAMPATAGNPARIMNAAARNTGDTPRGARRAVLASPRSMSPIPISPPPNSRRGRPASTPAQCPRRPESHQSLAPRARCRPTPRRRRAR